MLIHEVCRETSLTKKAIDYYELHGLIKPSVSSNGYREYNEENVERLKKISVLRKLDISVEEIKTIINDQTNLELHRVLAAKEVKMHVEQQKNEILQSLCLGKSYSEVQEELLLLEKDEMISNQLIHAFPGFYGRLLSLHFLPFLTCRIQSDDQKKAYDEIIDFLDTVPEFEISEELSQYLSEVSHTFSAQDMRKVQEAFIESVQDPEQYLAENKEVIEQYRQIKESSEYQSTIAYQFEEKLKQFQSVIGYNDVFIPAMRRLSSSYDEYYQQLEQANEKFLQMFSGSQGKD